jgi:hypothetical protein
MASLPLSLPGWLKPPHDLHGDEKRTNLSDYVATPIFLREVREWELRWQRMLFQILVPIRLLTSFAIDPVRLADAEGRPVAFVRPGTDEGSFRFELYPRGDAREPLAELELADTLFNQIEVVWVALQDPTAPRYNIDVMPDGQPTLRGTAARNLEAEQAAMQAGLAPGQVRRGLKAFGRLVERVETLMLCLNQQEYVAQPLYYHTAMLFEKYGFAYVQGQARMEAIAAGFASGGELRKRLDSSTPFRRPELADTIRGRSWAIHDGILPEPWDRMRMVKRLGTHAGIHTGGSTPW